MSTREGFNTVVSKMSTELTEEELKSFKPIEFSLAKEVKPNFVWEREIESGKSGSSEVSVIKIDVSQPKSLLTPELRQQQYTEPELEVFGGGNFSNYINYISEQQTEKKKKASELKGAILELQDKTRVFFKQLLFILEIFKVLEVYSKKLEGDFKKKINDFKENIVNLIILIGLHKDTNKSFFATLETADFPENVLTILKDKILQVLLPIIETEFDVEEMKIVNEVIDIFMLISGTAEKSVYTLRHIVVNGFNPSINLSSNNFNDILTNFIKKLTDYGLLYGTTLKDLAEKVLSKGVPELKRIEKMISISSEISKFINSNSKIEPAPPP